MRSTIAWSTRPRVETTRDIYVCIYAIHTAKAQDRSHVHQVHHVHHTTHSTIASHCRSVPDIALQARRPITCITPEPTVRNRLRSAPLPPAWYRHTPCQYRALPSTWYQHILHPYWILVPASTMSVPDLAKDARRVIAESTGVRYASTGHRVGE
eukprot:336624-Rhodomonas_salina.5